MFYSGDFLSGRGGLTNVKGWRPSRFPGLTGVTPPNIALFFCTAFRKGLAPFSHPAGVTGVLGLRRPASSSFTAFRMTNGVWRLKGAEFWRT